MAKNLKNTEEADQKLLEKLFKAQAHLGHKTNRIHPKAKKYIYRIENGVSIIDLTLTVPLLKKAQEYITKLASEKKVVLFVATKKISSNMLTDLCSKNNMSYISTKWPAGFLTNFETLMKNIKKMREMIKARDEGEWKKLVKFEQSQLTKKLVKLQRLYGGLINIETVPDALCIVDIKKEKNALIEAKTKSIPVIAIVDTNVDPADVAYPIPANDDSLTSIEYILRLLVESYVKVRKIHNPNDQIPMTNKTPSLKSQ
jgi:small subunit ribosomal protein S2